MNSTKVIYLASFLAISLVCYLTFFHRLGDSALWDPDEGRSGIIAKEMVNSGNWATLTHNGRPYHDKPALYFWLVALGLKLWLRCRAFIRLGFILFGKQYFNSIQLIEDGQHPRDG